MFVTKNFQHINTAAISGYYMSYQFFCNMNHAANLYYIPQKQQWLSLPEMHENWYTFLEIKENLQRNITAQKAPVVWVSNIQTGFHKLFITWW